MIQGVRVILAQQLLVDGQGLQKAAGVLKLGAAIHGSFLQSIHLFIHAAA